MLSAEPHGNQTLQRLSHDFRAGIAKHFFRSRVEHHHALFLVYSNQRVRRRVDDAFELRLTMAEGLFEAFLRGNVAAHAGDSEKRAGTVTQRKHGRGDRQERAVFAAADRLIPHYGLFLLYFTEDVSRFFLLVRGRKQIDLLA